MSPSRTRKAPAHRLRTRREVVTAVLGAAAVVVGTLVMIWLLRPGDPDTEGTGGLATRQPRATWLVVATIAALAWFAWWVLRRQRRWRERAVVLLVVGGLGILGVAAVAGALWPGGLLRDYPGPLDLSGVEDFPSTSDPEGDPTTPPTTAPGETSGPDTTSPTTTGSP